MLNINLTLVILMIMFLAFAVAMNAVFFRPVTNALEARRALVADRLAAADAAAKEAADLQADYKHRMKGAQVAAHEAVQTALRDADVRRQAVLEGVKAEVAADLASARASIADEKQQALDRLSSDVGTFSTQIWQKVLTGSGRTEAVTGG